MRSRTHYIVQTLQDTWEASKGCGVILSTRLQVSQRPVWVRLNSRRSNSWLSVIAASPQILIFLSNYSWQMLSRAFPCTYILRQNSQKTLTSMGFGSNPQTASFFWKTFSKISVKSFIQVFLQQPRYITAVAFWQI